MTDKEAIKYLQQLYPNGGHCWLDEQRIEAINMAIKALQEKPVKDRFAFKAIPRLLEMIEPTDKAKSYVTKLADAFDSEGYYTDAKIVRESLKIMNGEKVSMATMDEERVSEKKCMFTKDNYTDDDRKVLCADCKEKCEYSKKEKPVSDELEEASYRFACKCHPLKTECLTSSPNLEVIEAYKTGAKWQKEKDDEEKVLIYKHGFEDCKKQLMKDATGVTVHIEAGNYPYIPQIELYDYDKDVPLAKEGDKYKVVLIKED